jgi:chaperonin GroEL
MLRGELDGHTSRRAASKEIRTALENAASVAGLLLITPALVAESPSRSEARAGGPDLGDMDL